ncbi:MAG: VTT domain-containing protein [Clostridiales bacterium]|nr:VTT domain-containing protein [Clostridiales bacterium]
MISNLGTTLIVLAAACSVLLIAMQVETLQLWYATWQEKLVELEYKIASIKNWWLVVLTILGLFTAKGIFMPIPISAICFISGMVLPGYAAITVNVVGMSLLMTVKYFWGLHLGGGNASKIVRKNDFIRDILERDGTGNPYLLFLFRLIPAFPINSVSQLYGAMNFKFVEYLFISLAGFSYKLISYTIIGRNALNPLSGSFLIPIIAFLLISGIVLLSLNYIIDFFSRLKEKKINDEKSKEFIDIENTEKEDSYNENL